MEADSRQRISELYHQALARPHEERDTYLREACDGNDELRVQVESLLRYEVETMDFLERPVDVVSPADAPMIDRQLGPYRIVAPLGAGGMGEVYRARDTKLRREVAVKILPPHLTADPERRARFAREARVLATLNHPHIGAIYGLEDADGLTALVLELVDGPTLAERLQQGPLPIPQAVRIAQQVADALEAAHEKGVVHRDLKPANIVLQEAASDGRGLRAKVLDFGVAKTIPPTTGDPVERTAASADSTIEGRILGTPGYMSPEQARGLQVDRRTDVWSFGCVLFEMLTGRAPFTGDTTSDTLAAVLHCDPDWTVVPPETPPALTRLVQSCLDKDRSRRVTSMTAVRRLLEKSAAQASAARPPNTAEDEPHSGEPRGAAAPHLRYLGRRARGIVLASMMVVAAAAAFLAGVPTRRIRPYRRCTSGTWFW